ncbi:hypothetical protein Vadar_029376 [Vaccinium darrowii]|uniref:Uncharacterized protein n=1 Tax=Vaccinium darrowii TaxID=229202 RepID=A0ACB7YQL8_9ERIC|nr:hypothetical protein Vadar_029376 [Vaccinium darrowii]
MAEKIAFDIAANILSSLGSIAIQQIGLAWGVEKELENLRAIVSTIKNVLLDAQEQTNNHAVKEWLQDLKEILYDADDLLDEVATETKRRELETHNRLVRKVHYFFASSNSFAFRRKVGSKMKDIRERLEQIVSQIHQFKFLVKKVERPIETIRREETFSQVNTRRIMGRGDDIESFVRLLFSVYQENVIIIPIVGIGGLGKTTVAQLMYGDHRIESKFPKRLWVSVSTDFDIKRLLIKILKAGGECDNSCSNKGIPELEHQVTSMLRAEKFLLFLDDVWNENIGEWNRLENLLITGASGSRIVVTTRSMKVASMVRTSIVKPYKLRGLSERESLTLLVKLAFKEGEEKMHGNLVNIGNEIAKNCGGVPLAVVTLGSLLASTKDEQDWLSVRDNQMWALAQGENENDILPVLRLSYDQMPSNLKQCFAYCSLFERDEIIDGKKLLYAWMAQGFVQRLDENGELEDIGERYIRELVSRFFLEPYHGRTISNTTGRELYKMHSLVHCLAQDVAGDLNKLPKDLEKLINLRFLCLSTTLKLLPNKGLGMLTSLRTLIICDCEALRSVDEWIEHLPCLRELALDSCSKLLSLPADLSCLTSLERLEISSCLYLSLSDHDLKGLGSLKKLKLRNLPLLVSLPVGLLAAAGKLTHLEIEWCPYFTSPSESVLPNFESLESLKIWNCKNVGSLPEGMQRLTRLKSVSIVNCPFSTNYEEREAERLKIARVPEIELS